MQPCELGCGVPCDDLPITSRSRPFRVSKKDQGVRIEFWILGDSSVESCFCFFGKAPRFPNRECDSSQLADILCPSVKKISRRSAVVSAVDLLRGVVFLVDLGGKSRGLTPIPTPSVLYVCGWEIEMEMHNKLYDN